MGERFGASRPSCLELDDNGFLNLSAEGSEGCPLASSISAESGLDFIGVGGGVNVKFDCCSGCDNASFEEPDPFGKQLKRSFLHFFDDFEPTNGCFASSL